MIKPKGMIPNINTASELYSLHKAGEVESICLNCPLPKCTNQLNCKRYKEELKKIEVSDERNTAKG